MRDNTDKFINLKEGNASGAPTQAGTEFVPPNMDMIADYVDWRAQHPSDDLMTQLDLGVAPPAPLNELTNPSGLARPQVPEPAHRTVRHHDAPICMQCGVQMVPAGSCHACPSCGNTSGCS